MCKLLEVKREDATNKKVEQLEEFERYFDFERPDKYHFIIKEIYQIPKPGFENGFFYKTVIVPVKCSKEDYDYLIQCRKWAGDCWNALVKADKDYYEENKKFMNRSQLQSFVKGFDKQGNIHKFYRINISDSLKLSFYACFYYIILQNSPIKHFFYGRFLFHKT